MTNPTPIDARITVVVPVLDARDYLSVTVPALLSAAQGRDDVQVVFVDNGSSDGSFEFLQSHASHRVRVFRLRNATISALRNFGAAQDEGSQYVSFLDADCIVDSSYFDAAIDALETSGAHATGFKYELPPSPSWVEATWHGMHFIPSDRDVAYINGGNFFIRRSAFNAVGGFREDLSTGEDGDIGRRLIASGRRIFACRRVGAVHLGNATSLPTFFRQMVWHGLGMRATTSGWRTDRSTAMAAAHLLLVLTGVFVLAFSRLPLPGRAAVLLWSHVAIPVTSVLFRLRRVAYRPRWSQAVVLYWLFFAARFWAAIVIVRGHDRLCTKTGTRRAPSFYGSLFEEWEL